MTSARLPACRRGRTADTSDIGRIASGLEHESSARPGPVDTGSVGCDGSGPQPTESATTPLEQR